MHWLITRKELMKRLTFALFLLVVLVFSPLSHAQTLEDAKEAYSQKDYAVAFAGFTLLANQGDLEAQRLLGTMYRRGFGTQKDLLQAVHWYRKAAEKGQVNAQLLLGHMYRDGEGLPKDARLTAFWYGKAALQGNGTAQYYLGIMYEKGEGLPVDFFRAASLYRQAAEQGLAPAELSLANMYGRGRGVPKDDEQAVLWYRKAAEQGEVVAQTFLGNRYSDGVGVAKNENLATFWYQKAADQGFASAQERIGFRYLTGTGVVKNEVEARRWLEKAAEQGDDASQHNLGYLFFSGKGGAQNSRTAYEWYKKAADQGLAAAQFEVGAMLSRGVGTIKNDQQALIWYRKAADQGHTAAQSNLGVVYSKGNGVPKDVQQAYFWFLLASANSGERGASEAAENRDLEEKQLTPAQRASAQNSARNWKPGSSPQFSPSPSLASAGEERGPKRTALQASPPITEVTATGSGFRVARDVIVTNHHVIDGCSRLRVNGVAAQVRGSDARSDLAVLTAALTGPHTTLRAQRASVGEPVAVAGYPLRGLLSGFNMTTGNLSSLSGIGGDTRLVQITAPVQPGNSGGPLLDSSGNLVGVVVSKLNAIKAAKLTGDIPQNVNFAINANVLRSFLEANSVDYETANSNQVLLTTAIADKAKSFTVLVECWK